jgi:hypothetical protein
MTLLTHGVSEAAFSYRNDSSVPEARPVRAPIQERPAKVLIEERPLRGDWPLFRRLLGSSWDVLPPAIQRLHSVTTFSTFTGECTVERGGTLKYVVCRSYLLGIPLPFWLGPKSTACESAEDGCFRFDVEIRHIFTGPIVRYRGWLLENAR